MRFADVSGRPFGYANAADLPGRHQIGVLGAALTLVELARQEGGRWVLPFLWRQPGAGAPETYELWLPRDALLGRFESEGLPKGGSMSLFRLEADGATTVLLTTFAVLNLFIAIVVDSMSSVEHEEQEQTRELVSVDHDAVLTELRAIRAELAELRGARGAPPSA